MLPLPVEQIFARLYPGRADNQSHRRRACGGDGDFVRRAIEDDRFPHAPRLDPLRVALGKFEAAAETNRAPEGPAERQRR